jgi:hypothetical protein
LAVLRQVLIEKRQQFAALVATVLLQFSWQAQGKGHVKENRPQLGDIKI